MVGPFKRSKDKKNHLLVVVDKFTKWVEAEPISKCDAATAVQFMKKVILRFGFPHNIITDNLIFTNRRHHMRLHANPRKLSKLAVRCPN